ncbi:MAG: GldG family protein [Burkholderiaceae bacterium]
MASLDRNRRTLIGTVLAIVLFLALNSLVADLWRSKRLDLTEARLFTLSEGTRTVLAGLDEPIRLRLFISQDLVERAPQLAAYAARVQEMLQAYARMSENKLLLEIVHPQPFSDDEDQAVGLGVNQITVGGSQPIFFGLAATNSTDGKGAIPVFSPERETHLEYDLTRLVAELGQRGKGRLVLYDGIGLAGNPMARAPAQQVLQQMRQFFEITTIYGDVDELPADARVLMIVHPQQLSARTRFTIDQWVMNGGATLVFVDPHAETQLGPQPGVPAQDPASDLPELFKAWGIGFDVTRAVGDPVYALRSQRMIGRREIEVSTYPWLALPRQGAGCR